MLDKPRIFVASSSEQLPVALDIAAALREPRAWTVDVWDKQFSFSKNYIESLEDELDRADFAVVVMSGDDAATVRGKATVLPRDNVVFELGLFIGRLGRARCFFFVDAASATHLASDLSGVKAVTFHPEAPGADGTRPDLRLQVRRVKEQLRGFAGNALRYKPDAQTRSGQEALWRLSVRLCGKWWERMRRGDDHDAALSLVSITVDPETNTPKLHGWAYDLHGTPVAEWWSVTTGIVRGDSVRLEYRWEGAHEDTYCPDYGGYGSMVFDDPDTLASARGHFVDTHLSQADAGAATAVRHCHFERCSDEDARVMADPASPQALACIQDRLVSLRA